MTSKYRVIVLREGADADETLFEIAGSAARVARIAPGALLDVLAEDEGNWADAERALADRVFDSAGAAGAAGEQQAAGADGETVEQATKRKRRTKAEIAADKEAQAAGFRDAAHRAEVESAQGGAQAAGGDQVPAEVPSGPQAPAGPAAEVVVGSVPGPIVTEAAPAAVAPPYNPFAQ